MKHYHVHIAGGVVLLIIVLAIIAYALPREARAPSTTDEKTQPVAPTPEAAKLSPVNTTVTVTNGAAATAQ